MTQSPSNLDRARDLRDQGINAIRSGKKSEAQELLAQSLELNPDDEHAWLWLSGAADSDEDKRFCLEKVLALNPANTAARKGLAQLPARPRPAAAPATGATVALPPAGAAPATGATIALPPAAPAHAPAPPMPAPPASPPSAPSAAVSYFVPDDQRTYKRSGCVTCLGILSFLIGAFFVVVLVMFTQVASVLGDALQTAGIPTSVVGVAMAFLAVMALLYLSAGFGLMTGKKYAWWLTIFSFAYSITGSLRQIIDIIIHRKELVEMISSPEITQLGLTSNQLIGGPIILSVVSIVFSLLVITMLFIPDTLGFFKLQHVRKAEALGIVFAIAILITVGVSFITTSAAEELQQQIEQVKELQQPRRRPPPR